MVHRHGYYLPEKDMLCGDQELAAKSKEIFDSYGIPEPQRNDGVSIFEDENGKVVTRLTVTDFFSETFKVHVKDL